MEGWVDAVDALRLELLGRLLLAVVLGGVVGLEREASGKPAGFRTNILICVGSALLTDLSVTVARGAGMEGAADPSRIAAQIVSGIGFLGAGTIIQARGHVLGLTTAATLWVVAAIGMAVGSGAYVEAVGTTVLVVVVLLLLGKIESVFVRRTGRHTVRMTVRGEPETVSGIEEMLRATGIDVSTLDAEWKGDAVEIAFEASGSDSSWRRAMDRLWTLPGVIRLTRI